MDTAWHGLTRDGLDRAYNARASVADYEAEIRNYTDLSAHARATLAPTLDIVFDPATGLALDWFHGAPGGPVLLWIHGGYWRALAKADQSLVAPALVAAGAHVAIMDYQLAPAVTLDAIVHQARLALAFVAQQAATMGADPARLYAAGHSAGGHLVGMLLAPGWHADYGLRDDALQGGISLSGLFELAPIRLSHIDDWLRLNDDAVARLSPSRHVPPTPAPRILASYGGLESAEFRWQTEHYADAYRAAGHEAHILPQRTRNHFDIVAAFGNPDDPLGRAACDFVLRR